MAGTKAGGQAAASTNKKLYGNDYYAKIGAKGGRLGRTGGFAANRDLARKAGAKGGRISRRGKTADYQQTVRVTRRTNTARTAGGSVNPSFGNTAIKPQREVADPHMKRTIPVVED